MHANSCLNAFKGSPLTSLACCRLSLSLSCLSWRYIPSQANRAPNPAEKKEINTVPYQGIEFSMSVSLLQVDGIIAQTNSLVKASVCHYLYTERHFVIESAHEQSNLAGS